MADPIALLDAANDPEALARIDWFISRFRVALAPIMAADLDGLPRNQSLAMAAGALFAGMTVGHMIAVGAMKEQDKRRAGQVVLTNFRNGIELGKAEARKAMLEQLPVEGRA